MVCTPGSINFSTNRGNNPGCEKGGVWTWRGQSSDGIAITPSGNTAPVTVQFILTVLGSQNGTSYTNEKKTLNITFPATTQPAPTIKAFGNKDPNPTTGATVIMWQTSKVASNRNGFMDVALDVSCAPNSISFKTDKGNNPICEKGGIWAWSNTDGDSITVTPVGNTTPVTVPFTLTLNDQLATIQNVKQKHFI